MKMPEGWKRLKDCHDDLYPNDLYDLNVLKALELLREMAEALENITCWVGADISEHEISKAVIEDQIKAEEVIKRFKEWK